MVLTYSPNDPAPSLRSSIYRGSENKSWSRDFSSPHLKAITSLIKNKIGNDGQKPVGITKKKNIFVIKDVPSGYKCA